MQRISRGPPMKEGVRRTADRSQHTLACMNLLSDLRGRLDTADPSAPERLAAFDGSFATIDLSGVLVKQAPGICQRKMEMALSGWIDSNTRD